MGGGTVRLLPVGSFGSPPSVGNFRGVAIHWVELDPVTNTPGQPLTPSQKFTPKIPEPAWHSRKIPFTALTLDGADRPPATTVEQEWMVVHAANITAVHHPIMIGTPVYYEIGTWTPP